MGEHMQHYYIRSRGLEMDGMAANAAREVQVASADEYTDVCSKQTTGGKVWDAAVELLNFIESQPSLMHSGSSVLELGAGTGWLGMTLASRVDIGRMCMTELVEGGALEWLNYNVDLNRDAGLALDTVCTAPLDWTWMDSQASAPAECFELLRTQWDFVIGSDLVYNDAGMQMLPRVLNTLAQPETRILYSHTFNRFELLDRDFLEALTREGLQCRQAWPKLPEPTAATFELGEFSGELFPEQHIVVLEIQRQPEQSNPHVAPA
jgi:predicted nicotinamide N-methyase